jgi:glycosyltransferase 2 family protein
MVKTLMKKFNWKLLAKIVFTFLGVGWVLSQIDVNEVGRYLSDVPIALTIGCILIFNLSKFFCAIRLNMFFKQDGVFISEKENLKLYYKGMFYNIMLPGGIGGDGYKGYYLRNTLQVPVKNLVRPILWDRITGAVSIVIVIFVLVNFQAFIPDHVGLNFFLICSPLLMYGVSMIASNIIVPSYRGVFHSTTMLSLLNQLSQGLIVILLLYGLKIPANLFDEYLLVFFISSLATILPITLGGIGIREFIFIKAAEFSEIEQHTAVALSVLFFGITVVSALIGSIVKLDVRRPSVKSGKFPNKRVEF